jgi:hypothetical protein
MRKAFCTFGVGPYAEIMDISRPFFEAYCEKHKYEYFEQYPRIMGKLERPPSWGKIPLLLDLLEDYDVVLWSDCDALIIDDSDDLDKFVPLEDIQAMVFEDTPFGRVPCCGFWYTRPEMIPYLEEIWKLEKYIYHYWWEQRAFHELMGYEPNLEYLMTVPVRVRETELFHKTWRLDKSWNDFDFTNLDCKSRIIHFPVFDAPVRAEAMRKWLRHEEIKNFQEFVESSKEKSNGQRTAEPGRNHAVGGFGFSEAKNSGEVRLHTDG